MKFFLKKEADEKKREKEADVIIGVGGEKSFLGGLATDAGLALAHLCFENLMKYGLLAKRAMEIAS